MPDLMQAWLTEPSGFSLALLLFAGTFISEDAACLLAAKAVGQGRLDVASAITVCFAGIFLGDLGLYFVGRVAGQTRFVGRLASESRMRTARDWFMRRGMSTVFLSRFVSGVRVPTYLLAGIFRTDVKRFTAYLALAGAIWTPLLIGTVLWSQTVIFADRAWLGLVIAFLLLNACFHYSRWEQRRTLVGRWKRLTQWEFWPVQIFYIPVVLYIAALAVRYRSLTIFTAANPSIDAGGFAGESKQDIYRLLSASRSAGTSSLPYVRLSANVQPEERIRRAERFLKEWSLDYPLVVKPDVGERGKCVKIIKNRRQLEAALRDRDADQLVQEYVGGVEASIFYIRYPDSERCEIFSITEKQFPAITGDGRSTVRELILSDPRAVAMARKYFDELEERLDKILDDGEDMRLIEIGTHSRGSIFRDGGHLHSAALEARIDGICRSLGGFYFGRFDVKAPSFAELSAGRFKIIELNGVTSESTNIYDPRYTIFDAYRILFHQWRIAFDIGAQSVARGAVAVTLRDLIYLAIFRRRRPKNSASSSEMLTEF